MVIIEQNINQVKYSNQEDKLTAKNCYEKLINKNADIMILCEVTRPENIVKGISAITDKYLFECNEKVLHFIDKNGNRDIQNKIPEKVGKWKFEDFCTITGVTFIPLTTI